MGCYKQICNRVAKSQTDTRTFFSKYSSAFHSSNETSSEKVGTVANRNNGGLQVKPPGKVLGPRSFDYRKLPLTHSRKKRNIEIIYKRVINVDILVVLRQTVHFLSF